MGIKISQKNGNVKDEEAEVDIFVTILKQITAATAAAVAAADRMEYSKQPASARAVSICTITFRTLKDNQHAYLADLLVRPKCSNYLRSTNSNRFVVPRIKTKSFLYIWLSLMERPICANT